MQIRRLLTRVIAVAKFDERKPAIIAQFRNPEPARFQNLLRARRALAIALQPRARHIRDPHNLSEHQLPRFRRRSATQENVARDLTEKGAAYAKDTYAKTQAAAGETTKIMQQTYAAASKGAADFNVHLLDMAQANMDAAFDFAHQLARVTSPTQFFELSAAHARKQLETLTEQTQQLTTLAQKVTTGAAQPWTGIGKTFNQSS